MWELQVQEAQVILLTSQVSWSQGKQFSNNSLLSEIGFDFT